MDQHGEALRPRDRDVETMGVEQELHPAGNVFTGRAGHCVEDDWGLLTLEAIHGADPDPGWHERLDLSDGEVVGGDDQYVFRHQRTLHPLGVGDGRPGEQLGAGRGDRTRLLRACLAATLVLDRQRP